MVLWKQLLGWGVGIGGGKDRKYPFTVPAALAGGTFHPTGGKTYVANSKGLLYKNTATGTALSFTETLYSCPVPRVVLRQAKLFTWPEKNKLGVGRTGLFSKLLDVSQHIEESCES